MICSRKTTQRRSYTYKYVQNGYLKHEVIDLAPRSYEDQIT